MEEKQRSPDAEMNWLDRSIAWISPAIGYARMAWRTAIRGAYAGGDIGRRSEQWTPVNAKAEQINQPQRDLLRARAREQERNGDIVGSIVGTYERNVVSTGLRLQAATGDETRNTEFEDIFAGWSKPRNCDITGQQAFWELCKMAVRRRRVDGGILFIKTYGGNPKYPFQLQAREVDDLDNNGILKWPATGNVIINGVEVDRNQKPVAYHLKVFSADGWYTGKTERIPADRVIYLWRKKLPSEVREVTPLASALPRVNDTEEFLDAVGIKEKILASLSVFIKRVLPSGGTPGRGTTASSTTSDYDPQTGYKRKKIAPGMIMDLQPGDDVSAVIPTGQAANAREMVSLNQRLIGAGQGLSYEATSRDMSQVNYSSARQGLLEDQRSYEDEQQYLEDHLLSEVYTEVIISAYLAGTIKLPDFWAKKEDYLRHRWIPPGWTWIDPLKEIMANQKAIESGQDNLANICARTGYDWREVMEQRAKELAFQKELEEKYGVKMTEGGKPIAQQATAAAADGDQNGAGSGND